MRGEGGGVLTVVAIFLVAGSLVGATEPGLAQGNSEDDDHGWLSISLQGGPSYPSGLGANRSSTALYLAFSGSIRYSSQSAVRFGYGGSRYSDGSHSVTYATAEWVHNVVKSSSEWNVTTSVGGGVNSYCDSDAILGCGYQHELNVFNETVWTATGGVRIGRDVSRSVSIFMGTRAYWDSKGWSIPVVGGIQFAFGG